MNEMMAALCAGECPFGYQCRDVDCEECMKTTEETGEGSCSATSCTICIFDLDLSYKMTA